MRVKFYHENKKTTCSQSHTTFLALHRDDFQIFSIRVAVVAIVDNYLQKITLQWITVKLHCLPMMCLHALLLRQFSQWEIRLIMCYMAHTSYLIKLKNGSELNCTLQAGSLEMSQVAHLARAYPGFCSMKRPYYSAPGWNASPLQGH